MVIKREIQEKIESKFFQGKAVVIYGARQVGKTTLLHQIREKYPQDCLYLNCDEPDYRERLTNVTSTQLGSLIGGKKIILVDEAQRVENIGLTIKLLVDNLKTVQLVATGSSSFDLSNKIVEPLTGRKYEFYLYPFSVKELTQIYSPTELPRMLETRLIFGSYPEVVLKSAEATDLLKEITRSYLYKDVLQFQQIRHADILEKLLQALALQIGNEVSYNELSSLLGINKVTVASYIELLEKAFIIFRLKPYSRNLRKELSKLRKIYFVDLGIRNALINNFNPLTLRQDVGSLWENFVISERIKFNKNKGINTNIYFWRTHQKQEIDYLEESAGKLSAFEIKWQKKKAGIPKIFAQYYKESVFNVVEKENIWKFVGVNDKS